MHPPLLSAVQFQDRLRPLLESSPQGAVVFDADGTLWSHDVGCMVFDWAVAHELLRAEAADALFCFAQEQGLSPARRDAPSLARDLQSAFYQHRLNNRAAAMMQVWAYAGITESEFRALVRDALLHGQHERTVHRPILDLANWIRNAGGQTFIVSASPQWVVEEAAAELGFVSQHIAAGRPNLYKNDQGQLTISAGLAEPLPYGPEKVKAGRRLMGTAPWLAALGDSSFDVDMLSAAQLAGGIGEKPDMLAGLARLSHGVRVIPG